MASADPSSTKTDSEFCSLCSSKYSRTRASFCLCKHCSTPFCFDCTREHHDELLQDVGEISHDYNQLQEVLQTKKTMIMEETRQSIEIVNEYFKNYIAQLHETHEKIFANMNQSMENAKKSVEIMEKKLRVIGDGIQSLVKEGMIQTSKMQDLVREFGRIRQQIQTYQIVRTENFISTQPDYSIKFDSISEEVAANELPMQTTASNIMTSNLSAVPKFPLSPAVENPFKRLKFTIDASSSDDSDSDDNCIETTYKVDRLASDGKGIFYTSYKTTGTDRIAYCTMEDDDDYEDEYRSWKKSRIQDIIWWNHIKQFIFATNDGVYTVEYAKKMFKITDVIHEDWSDVRLAANTTHLLLWIRSTDEMFNGIKFYSHKFKCVNKINFDQYQTDVALNTSIGFCVTDHRIATTYIKKENYRHVLQLVLYDMNMKLMNSIDVGEYLSSVQIRTDGKRFFITVDKRQISVIDPHYVRPSMISLQSKGKWIDILDNQRLAVSNGGTEIEIIDYEKQSGNFI